MARKRRIHGEGAVYQRPNGQWVGRLELGQMDGKRRRRFVSGETAAEVSEKLRALATERDAGAGPPDRQTVEAYLLGWLEDAAAPSLRPRTLESYEMIVRRHLIPGLGKIKLGKLVPRDVQRYLNGKRADGLSARTVTYHRAVLRKALNDAVGWGLVGRNAAVPVRPPRQERPERRYLTPDEARQLLEGIAGDPLEALVVTTLGLGLREGEVLGLRWQDVDLEAGSVNLRVQVQRLKGQGLVLVPLKTTASHASVPLPGIVTAGLRTQRRRVLAQRLAAGELWRDNDLVFPSEVGTPIDARNLARRWQALRGRLGLDWLPFHGLRHGFGSLLAARGVHPRVAMQLMRHSQFSLTMEVYTHVAPDMAREAADEIDRVLAGS